MFFKKANVKVCLAGFVYVAVISTACYVVKSGIRQNELLDTGNKTPITIATTIYMRRFDGNHKGLKQDKEHHNETEEIKESIDSIIEDGIFWSSEVERLLPKGTSEEAYHFFLHALDTQQVRVAENAAENKCANKSPNNKYIELDNGMKMCARHRQKSYLDGEVLSFHIARLLGLDNVPPVKMLIYNRNSYLWEHVKNATGMKKWSKEHIITLSQWIEGLEEAIPIPQVLRKCLQTSATLTSRYKLLNEITLVQIIDLVQMSDLLIFDFIVQSRDRILNNKLQHNRPKDWRNGDHRYLWSPIKNLDIQKHTLPNQLPFNKFWLIDNEQTNFVSPSGSIDFDETIDFNEDMMKTMCIFRRSTIENIKSVIKDGNPCKTFYTEISTHDDRVFSHESVTFMEVLNRKLLSQMREVLMWVDKCQLQMQS